MAIPQNNLDELNIKLRDPDDQLVSLIKYIKNLSAPGHSFSVVVDPNDRENKEDFYIDGDGSFFIKEIKKNGINIENIKVVEGYLNKIQ